MTFMTGIFLTAVRLYEPLFRHYFVKQMYEFFGMEYAPTFSEYKTEEEFRVANDGLFTILASSLNVELVYIVLKSITAFSKEEIMKRNQANRDSGNTGRISGLLYTENLDKMKKYEPVQEIEFRQSHSNFMKQVNDEVQKRRHLILKQIEVKTIDTTREKKVSEFISSNETESREVEESGTDNSELGSFMRKTNSDQLTFEEKTSKGMSNSRMDSLHATCVVEKFNVLMITEDVKITEYAPAVFHAIRKMDNITSAMIE